MVSESSSNNTSQKKSKLIALLLAVFLGPWTWVYTFRRDPGKAAAGLGWTVNTLFIFVLAWENYRRYPPVGFDDSLAYLFLGVLQAFSVIWLIAVVATVINKDWSYSGRAKRAKLVSVLLSIALGPWTWLYTYERDKWKFLSALLIDAGGYSVLMLLPSIADRYYIGWPLVLFGIWGLTIFVAVLRPSKWYSGYSNVFVAPEEPQVTQWIKPGKNKFTAMILAVFLGICTWLYTYRRDGWKFWTVLISTICMSVINLRYLGENQVNIRIIIYTVSWLMAWLWPLIDVLSKKDSWYSSFESG